MSFLRYALLLLVLTALDIAAGQQPVATLKGTDPNGNASSEGYKPPPLSLSQLLESDHVLNEAIMTFAQTGDHGALRSTIMRAARAGNVGAELLLAEQYIPEQCSFEEPNQDVPHCGKSGNEPHVVFRQNPLGIDASYEEASKWLEKASAQGSGEASEVLAQMITRMQSNGHGTHYTPADSTRFHALARSQDFDVELVLATCYKLVPGRTGITLGRLPGFIAGDPPEEPFTPEEIKALGNLGISGQLLYGGGSGFGESVPLTRPEGPAVRVRIILDHDPGSEVLLPMPAHHDQIYVQRGDQFLALPNVGKILPRSIGLEPQTEATPQVSVSTQHMDGVGSSGFCTRFP